MTIAYAFIKFLGSEGFKSASFKKKRTDWFVDENTTSISQFKGKRLLLTNEKVTINSFLIIKIIL